MPGASRPGTVWFVAYDARRPGHVAVRDEA